MGRETRFRTVLITGGAKGLGADISGAFHAAGYHVITASRSDSGLAGRLGKRARFVACDVRRPESLRAAVDAALEFTGRLDVVVNNAGLSEWRPLANVDEAFWTMMLDTNLKGVFFGCQAAAAHLGEGGCIINISSLAGKRGSANNSVYCASKFGVDGVTQALAKELGPRGIRVNAVCPVYIQTQGLLAALQDSSSPTSGASTASYLTAFAAGQSALGRLPTGAQVADVCVFLASPAAAAVTGQCLNVDCGVMPQ
jgi:3-oxoacyl-[acyl-carrier protein] reductase/meso-butanediol dehydrogenase/(S,S)-butanediol dehydrogenase/diacetyl reductase